MAVSKNRRLLKIYHKAPNPKYYRPKHFNALKVSAWMIIVLIALCAAALIVR